MAGKRRANGEGSISKRSDGRWQARYRVTEPNGVRKTRYIYGTTKEEVAKKLRTVLKELEDNGVIIKNQYSLSSFYQIWREGIAPNYLQPTTIEGYDWVFNRYILPNLGKKRLESLSTRDIQLLVNQTYAKTGSARICKEIRNCLSGVLKRAIKQQLLARNPTAGVESRSYKPKEKQPWSIEELNFFLSKTTRCRYSSIFKIASYYGMRKGEVLGLRAKDVELFSDTSQGDCYGFIHIRQQVSLVNNRPVVREHLKTESSRRDLPISGEIVSLLAALLPGRDDEELLFHTRNNSPINPNNLLRAFKRESKKLGLRAVTFHSLRHTACTLLRDAGVDVKTAQVWLGHSDPTTTLRVYQHSGMEKKVEATIKLDSLYHCTSA